MEEHVNPTMEAAHVLIHSLEAIALLDIVTLSVLFQTRLVVTRVPVYVFVNPDTMDLSASTNTAHPHVLMVDHAEMIREHVSVLLHFTEATALTKTAQ
jgi:hypothetical protein